MTAVSVTVTVHLNVTSCSLIERSHFCRTTCFRRLPPWMWKQEVFLKRWWIHTRPCGVAFKGTVFINFEHLSWRLFQCPLIFGCYQSIILPCRISCQSCVSYCLIFYLSFYIGGGCGGCEFCHTSSFNVFSLWFILHSIESVTYGICNSVLISK
jgi:hypothetical protein